jgi:trk system potassium uptake protein
MYVVVGGAGEVGYHVARALRDEGHDVAVVEKDAERLERLQELDILAVLGNVANHQLLQKEARIADADLFIATTGEDEVNMVACALAKTHGARTICRMNETDYLSVPYSSDYKAMGIDVAVSPQMVAAIRIKRLLNQPNITNVDAFVQGKVIVAEGRVTEDAFVVGKRVSEIEPPEGFNLFAIYRGDEVIIPRGKDRFHAHDRLLMALSGIEVLKEVEPYIGRARQVREQKEVKRVMIAGATQLGVHLARLLEQTKRDVVLIERKEERCIWAGERLSKTLIVHGDVTDRELLIQENVDTFDAFVAATKVEEFNVLAALIAKQLGVSMTVAVINQPELKTFLEKLEIDLAVAPRLSTVGAILRHVHPAAEDVALQNLGEERLVTYRVDDDSAIAGKKIKSIHWPEHTIVAALVRGDEVILPRGDDEIRPQDRLICYALSEAVERLERLFK